MVIGVAVSEMFDNENGGLAGGILFIACLQLEILLSSVLASAILNLNIQPEKPRNCATKADGMLDTVFFSLAGKHNANPFNILVHLQPL